MIVYSMVVIPWRISFRQDAIGGVLIFDYIVDAVFGIDIVVCFNAAYFEEVQTLTRAQKDTQFRVAYHTAEHFWVSHEMVGALLLHSCMSCTPVLGGDAEKTSLTPRTTNLTVRLRPAYHAPLFVAPILNL